jgi:hypothetical protein
MLGESVVDAVEARRAEQKRREAQAEEEKRRRKEQRVRAAEVRLRALQANRVPHTDPQYQAALADYQAALSDYLEQPDFRLPTTTVGGRPATPETTVTIGKQRPEEGGLSTRLPSFGAQTETLTIPGQPAQPGKEVILPLEPGEAKPLTWSEFADSIGLPMTPEQRQQYGSRPWNEVLTLNNAARQLGRPLFPALTQEDDELVTRTHNHIANYIRLISAATTPTEREAAVDAARRWKQSVLAQYPQLAALFPDFAGLGSKFEREARQAAEAKEAGTRYDTWRTALREAYQRYREAFRGIDPYELADAISAYNRLVDVGVQAGYYEKGVGNRLPSFEQLRPTWLKAREQDILRSNLDLATKQANLARLRRELAEGGREATTEERRGPYVIRDYLDRRGSLTKQVVTDARTGKVITNEMLERRAAQGDKDAAALLGYEPRPATATSIEQQLAAIRQLSDADLDRAEARLNNDLLDARGLTPTQLADIRRLQQAIRDERGRRLRLPPPGYGGHKGATKEERLQRLEKTPPSAEAALALRLWRQSKKPIPRDLWNKLGALGRENQEWLEALGVAHE